MASSDTPDLSCTLAVLLAGGRGTRLHELSTTGSKPALPLAGRRLADFAIARTVAAGLPRLIVALDHRPETLARHLPEIWGGELTLSISSGAAHDVSTTALALARALEGEFAREVLVLPADQVHALDLAALIAAHRAAGAAATLCTTGEPGAPGPCILDWPSLREAVISTAGGDLWADLLPALAARGELALWRPPAGAYWRDIDTLDDFREVAIEFRRSRPCELPASEVAGPLEDEEGRALAFEVAGLRLSAPRFRARQRGRWTLIEDSVVLPGARVAPGARLTRALVAPGAIVPANLTVGEDAEEDARWFRVTPGGTTLVTAGMLATRATQQMGARLGDRLSRLASPKVP